MGEPLVKAELFIFFVALVQKIRWVGLSAQVGKLPQVLSGERQGAKPRELLHWNHPGARQLHCANPCKDLNDMLFMVSKKRNKDHVVFS